MRIWLYALLQRARRGVRIERGVELKGLSRIELGMRCKLHCFCSIDAGQGPVSLGAGCTLNRYAMLQSGRGEVRLGERVEVNNHSIINGSGSVVIGDDSLIGPGVRIISYQHAVVPGVLIRRQANIEKPIRIGRDVWIGANAVVLAGVTIGDGAVIGAGAVVTHDVPAGEIWAGVPARRLRTR